MACSQTSRVVQSTCAYCGVGCGVDISVENEKANSLVGTPEHPANFGKLCVKGTNLLATTDLTNRLLAPEINGEVVDWQSATDFVAQQFNKIIEEHGSDAVAFYLSGQLLTEDYYLANKLMKGYIGSANIDTNSRLCMSSAVSAYKQSLGEDVVPCSYDDLDDTELLLITGSNAAWTHPVLFQRIERAKKRNPNYKVVVIDPRKTATAELADYFLPIKPGTDAAFFNGLLHYLSHHDGLDNDYIKQHTEGFTATLANVNEWTLSHVATFCDLPEALLLTVYQLFLQSDKVITFYSMGINQSSSGVDKCQSIINCHLASGRIAKAGCGPFSITGQPNAMGGREVGGLSNQLTAHLDIENIEHRSLVQSFWQSPTMAPNAGYKAVELFNAIEAGKVKAVWIMATNPLVSLPEREKVEKALALCDLVVVSDCVEHNDTLEYANVKLPATPWLEKNGTVTNSERRISRQRNSIAPNGQAKHDWQIIAEVANKMGFSGFNYTHVSEVFTEFAALTGAASKAKKHQQLLDLSGLAQLSVAEYDQLKPIQWPVNTQYPDGCKRVFEQGQFSTPTGKARFISITPKLPIQQVSQEYPYLVNSGRLRDQWHTMTRTGKAAQLSAHTDKSYLYVNPKDAQTLSVKTGELVAITSAVGHAVVPIIVVKSQRVGECFMPIHWNKQFASSANVSALYQSITDPISGQVECKQGAVNIEKVVCAQFAELHVCEDFVMQITLNNDYWSKARTNYGMSAQFANKKIEHDELGWCQSISQISGEWLQFTQSNARYIVCMQEGRVVLLAYFSSEWPEIESAWLSHVFSQDELAFAELQSLLLGHSSAEFSKGRQVCSCYNVGEKEIISAINQGCNSVDKLGSTLKCGTNCGSCKSELSALVIEHTPITLIDETAESAISE